MELHEETGRQEEGAVQESIVRWMWNPTEVTRRNLATMVAAAFVFSQGNNRRLGFYWIYLFKNGLLSRPLLDSCILEDEWRSDLFNAADTKILMAGKGIFAHKAGPDLTNVRRALSDGYSEFVTGLDDIEHGGELGPYQHLRFDVTTRAYADSLDQMILLEGRKKFNI